MRAKLTTILALVISIGLVVNSSASAKRPKKYTDIEIPPIEWTPPEYSEFNLPNGISGLVVEDNEVPLIDFYFSFPSPPDPVEKVGLASMTSWVLRNGGSVNIPADSLNELLEFKSASLWIYAGQEQLEVSGFCLREDLEFVLSLTIELISNPAYPEDIVNLRRDSLLEYIRRQNDRPRWIALRELYTRLYPDHPWGRENSINTVNAITREDLVSYHNLVFQPTEAVFGIAGDIDLETAKALTEKYFGSMTAGDVDISPLPSEVEQTAPGLYYIEKEASQAFVTVGHLTITDDHPQKHAATIMNYILGGSGFQSRLLRQIRVNEGLAYSTWSSFSSPVPVKGCFIASASTKIDKAGRTLTLINEILNEYKENGPTEEEFEKAKQAYVNSYVWKFEDSDEILSRLVYLKWRGLPLNSPQRDLAAYQALTLEEVKAAAHDLLHPDQLITVVVGIKEKMDRPLEDFGEVQEIKLTE